MQNTVGRLFITQMEQSSSEGLFYYLYMQYIFEEFAVMQLVKKCKNKMMKADNMFGKSN